MNNTAGYIALVHKNQETSYGVTFPDVPGCISAGDTFEDAGDNAAVALAGHLASVMEADGDAIPRRNLGRTPYPPNVTTAPPPPSQAPDSAARREPTSSGRPF
jgi:predicted RNase H-like HicB family nuclease